MRLYLNESVSVVLSNLLQQHGVDCRTARDAGHLGATDEHQLTAATQEGRILFTHDTRDFLQLATDWHSAGKIHAGILLAHQAPLRELILRFRAFLLTRLFMNASAAIADSPLQQACTRLSRVQAGGLATRSVNILHEYASLLVAPRARFAWRLHDFATKRHE